MFARSSLGRTVITAVAIMVTLPMWRHRRGDVSQSREELLAFPGASRQEGGNRTGADSTPPAPAGRDPRQQTPAPIA